MRKGVKLKLRKRCGYNKSTDPRNKFRRGVEAKIPTERERLDKLIEIENIKSVKKAIKNLPDSRSIQQRDPSMGGLY